MVKVNKKAWILAQDKTLAAHELVTLAKKAGIQLDAGYVYMTRYKERKVRANDVKRVVSVKLAAKRQGARAASKAKDPRDEMLLIIARAGTINCSKWLAEVRAADV